MAKPWLTYIHMNTGNKKNNSIQIFSITISKLF